MDKPARATPYTDYTKLGAFDQHAIFGSNKNTVYVSPSPRFASQTPTLVALLARTCLWSREVDFLGTF